MLGLMMDLVVGSRLSFDPDGNELIRSISDGFLLFFSVDFVMQ
jgi:hypothetical protein